MKNLYAAEIAEAWQAAGSHPTRAELAESLRHGIFTQDQSRLVDLREEIGELREHYRKAWLAQYTPFRLTPALARWDLELQYWLRLQTWFADYIQNFRDGGALPSIGDALRRAK
jgi:hypothetical protein